MLSMIAKESSILVVGDGDFSYSVDLLNHYSGSSLTCTVFLSQRDHVALYGEDVENNASKLRIEGASVLYSIDVTRLPADVKRRKYNLIIFNFPHSGGKSNISKNRKLLKEMFKSFSTILSPMGNVRVALLPGQGGTPADGKHLRVKGNAWNVQDAAAQSGFILTSIEEFDTSIYNLSGYRSSSKAFFCQIGIRHTFKHCPFRLQSVRMLVQHPPSGSYLEMHLKKMMNVSMHPNLKLRLNGCLGKFSDLVSIDLDDADCKDSSKRIQSSESDITSELLKHFQLTDIKSIFYPPEATRVLYPPQVDHDVSFWTGSSETPNILPILLDCVGLAFHEISHKEVFYREETGQYAHNFRITYCHPFEAMSEELVKSLAHQTVRSALQDNGYDLH